MIKNKLIRLFIICFLIASAVPLTGYAAETEDYYKIYLNFAEDAEKNSSHDLNNSVSALIMTDLNRDNIPELIACCTSGISDSIYAVYKGYYIENSVVKENSPWNQNLYNIPLLMDTLPTNSTSPGNTVATNKDGKDYLLISCIPANDEIPPSFSMISFGNDGFKYTNGEYNENIFSEFSHNDGLNQYMPVASVKYTGTESMTSLIQKFKSSYSITSTEKNETGLYKTSDWAAEEVKKAYETGLIPDIMQDDNLTEKITRAEFAAIATTLYNKLSGTNLGDEKYNFKDITGHPYEKYIQSAYAYGITSGTDYNSETGEIIFSPDTNITREQLATMLCRVMKKYSFEGWTLESDVLYPLDISGIIPFEDDIQISDYAKESVYYMSKNNITNGVDDTHFAPLETASKEQAILLSLRIFNTK